MNKKKDMLYRNRYKLALMDAFLPAIGMVMLFCILPLLIQSSFFSTWLTILPLLAIYSCIFFYFFAFLWDRSICFDFDKEKVIIRDQYHLFGNQEIIDFSLVKSIKYNDGSANDKHDFCVEIEFFGDIYKEKIAAIKLKGKRAKTKLNWTSPCISIKTDDDGNCFTTRKFFWTRNRQNLASAKHYAKPFKQFAEDVSKALEEYRANKQAQENINQQ